MKKFPEKLKKLIKLLADGEFHSGNELGETLEITRSAIWKYISQLEADGIHIESIKNKGYRLIHPLILLDSNRIKRGLDLPAHLKPKKIETFYSISSTNDYLNQHHDNSLFKVCLAEQQTAGKGRLSREWFSPFGSNLYLSIAWHYQHDISLLSGLSLIVGIAVAESLAAYGIEEGIAIKWPNDIYYHEKKLAGILIEISAESHASTHVTIGIGMNVNMKKDHEVAFNTPWTSLSLIAERYHDRNHLTALLVSQCIRYLDKFSLQGLSDFSSQWQQYDYLAGKSINIIRGEQVFSGVAAGIDQNGCLLLKSGGKITAHSAGDASIASNAR